MEKKVGLIIAGAAKCATTTLFVLLKRHPEMCASSKKETNFFSRHENWREELSWYHGLFKPLPDQILFEASPSYTGQLNRAQKICNDIYEYNPDMKVVYMVRNPRDRIVSAYMHHYQRYRTDLDLHKALTETPGFLNKTRYYTHIMPFINTFGRDQILIIDFDDFIQDQYHAVEEIAHLLGIRADHFRRIEQVHLNRSLDNAKHNKKFDEGWYKLLKRKVPRIWKILAKTTSRKFMNRPVLSHADQKMILDVLDSEIDQLEMLMGKSLQHWKEIHA